MRHGSPTLPGMTEFEAGPSPHPPWMKKRQLLRRLWTSVGCRGFPGSRGTALKSHFVKKHHISVCSKLALTKSLSFSLFVHFSPPWQQASRNDLPSGDFCSPARFSPFCWPSVKIRHWQMGLLLMKCWALVEEASSAAHQNLLADGALCWILRLTAVEQTACDMTNCMMKMSEYDVLLLRQ